LDFVVPLWAERAADQIERVSTDEATAMLFRLAREEGIFAGTSAGANVVVASRLAEVLKLVVTFVTTLRDNGMKYLSTAFFATHAENRGQTSRF